MNRISSAARAVARSWAGDRPITPFVLRDLAEQAQEHLDHGADQAYLELLASWMAVAQPTWRELTLAMAFPSAPRPLSASVPPQRPAGRWHGHPCPCGGATPACGPAAVPRRKRHVTKRGA